MHTRACGNHRVGRGSSSVIRLMGIRHTGIHLGVMTASRIEQMTAAGHEPSQNGIVLRAAENASGAGDELMVHQGVCFGIDYAASTAGNGTDFYLVFQGM